MYSFIVLMSLSAHLVDLSLQVVDHLRRHLVTQDLVQVDALVSRDGLVGGQLYAFLYLQVERGRLEYVCGEVRRLHALTHLLYLGVLGNEEGVLRLLDGLARESRTLSLGPGRRRRHRQHCRAR